jgi:hypothetical protein
MVPAVSKLVPVLKAALQDPESADVRVNALLAFGEIASNVDSESEEEVSVIQEAVPAMIAILKDAVASGDEERAVKCFEMFQQTMVLAAIFFNTHFKDIIDFMLQVMVEDSIDVELRLQAIYFLIAAVNARKMKVQALRLGEELALHALRLVVDIDKFDDDGERNPGRQSLVLLDVLSENLPPNHVVLPLMQKVGEMSKNSEPTVRRAGILALSVCVEGAPDFFSTQLKELIPLILHLLEDESPIVRGAALQTVARLAEELQDEVAVLHDSLIPAIIKNFDAGEAGLNSASSKEAHKIVLDSCIALEAFMDVLEKEHTANYIEQILPRLSRMLLQDDDKIKMVSVAAIGALAHSAEELFLPYFKDCMQGLGALLQEKEDEDKLRLRQTATDAIGKIALAVGPTEFEPYVQRLMQVSEEALHLKDSDLRESSYILWSHLAKVYGEDFEPFIEGVVKGLTDTLEQEENMISDQAFSEIMTKIQAARTENDGEGLNDEIEEILKSSKAAKILVKDDDVEDSEDDDAMDGDDSDDDSDGPATALGLEKEVALEVLGDVFTHTKSKFLPYFETSIKLVIAQLDHHSYSVRQAALGTLWRAYATIWQIENENFKLASGGGAFQTSDKLKQLAALAMKHSLEAWDEENERYVDLFYPSPPFYDDITSLYPAHSDANCGC